MKEILGYLEELKTFLGPYFLPNESDFLGMYGRVSSTGPAKEGRELLHAAV